MIASGTLFGIYLVAIKYLFPSLNDTLRELIQKFLTLQETQMYFVAIFTIIILYVGSWLLSIRIYAKKSFEIKQLEPVNVGSSCLSTLKHNVYRRPWLPMPI